jgi:hypothetical protein
MIRSFSVPLLVGMLPIVAINITYLVSASEGYIPWCVPYWDSCTSISATGRSGTAFFIFKITMIPAAILLMWYWKLAVRKLDRFGDTGSTILIVGVIGAIFLIVYTIALGAVGDMFRLQRRVGIIIFFTFTYLAQLLFTHRVEKLALSDPTRPIQLTLCGTVLVIGLLTLILDVTLENYDDYENAFEWIIALLLQCYFIVSHWSWKNLQINNVEEIPFKKNDRQG